MSIKKGALGWGHMAVGKVSKPFHCRNSFTLTKQKILVASNIAAGKCNTVLT